MSHYIPVGCLIRIAAACLFVLCAPAQASGDTGQTNSIDHKLSQLVAEFKADSLGPYDGSYWFCDDGSVHPGDEPCDSIGGVLHGLPKDVVDEIGRHHGIYFGQTLSGTQFETFLDDDRLFSRAKQYQLATYLQTIDDGWIMQTARFTPGLIDSTDEAAWGRGFLVWLCEHDEWILEQFFIIRQFAGDIPHEPATVFRTELDSLVQPPPAGLASYLKRIPEGAIIWNELNTLINADSTSSESIVIIADLIFDIRRNILLVDPEWRIDAIDLSLALEKILVHRAANWRPTTVEDALRRNHTLARASAGCGYIGLWEWDKIAPSLIVSDDKTGRPDLPVESYTAAARRVFEWSASMIAAHYGPVEGLYSGFEPLATGFTDYRMRSTLLPLMSTAVGETQAYLASLTALDNEAFADSIQSQFRGMDSGVTGGILRVASMTDTIDSFSADTIYALPRLPDIGGTLALLIPADSIPMNSLVWPRPLSPRLPVSSISDDVLTVLASANGTEMFYAVSPQGRVILKPAAEASEDEALLIGVSDSDIDNDMVQTDRLDLDETGCVPVTSIPESGRDRVCGAGAAAIGELSTRFPGAVPDAFVIPFGVFRKHFDQNLPGTDRTYWDFVDETYEKAREWREDGELERVIDHIVMLRFAQLREMIQSMPLLSDFRHDLTRAFTRVFDGPPGTIPVNLRVYTNAAGLEAVMGFDNPVWHNLKSESSIEEAILDAWISIFSEASYNTRQRHTAKGMDIYPSILIQRAINFEKSSVMLTTGLVNNEPEDITVTIGWGVGVSNNFGETYLLKADGTDVLLSPSRQLEYSVLSAAGGLGIGYAPEMTEMTGTTGRLALRHLAAVVRSEVLKFMGSATDSPVVLDLGFESGNLWILGIRPLATDKRAVRQAYLSRLDSDSWIDLEVSRDEPFPGAGPR